MEDDDPDVAAEVEAEMTPVVRALEAAVQRRGFQLRARDVLTKAATLADDLLEVASTEGAQEAYEAWVREVRLFLEANR